MGPKRLELAVPFPIRTVNVWLFEGERPAMVDCGIGGPDGWQRLCQGMAEQDFAPDGADLYLSHGHVDHAGNAARLRQAHGVRLHTPLVEAPFVSTFRRDGEARNDAYAEALAMHGMPQERVARLRAGSDAIDTHLDDTPIDHDLKDGQRVMLGDAEATAIRTPGHTPGSTCYLLEDGDLLTGDTLLERITSNALELLDDDRGAHQRYLEAVDGMRRFLDHTALPGHHAPFRITEALLDDQLERQQERADRVLSGLHRPRTAWDLMPDVFPGLHKEAQHFMAMAEIVGNLHALEIQGKARSMMRDGVRRFQATP